MKVNDVIKTVTRHDGIRLRTVRHGNYEYAYLVQRKPVRRAVLSYASSEEEVPRACIKYIEARFKVRLEEGNGAYPQE